MTEPRLQYCLLHAGTNPDTAVRIFIDVNKTAVKLKDIDIAVALAEAEYGADLRARADKYLDRSEELGHYFNPQRSKAVPEVAEWMLKVGCLRVREEGGPDGRPPRAMHYPSAVACLFGDEGSDGAQSASGVDSRLRQVEDDMDAALRFAALRGGATKRTLPSWPPVHVIAALQEDLRTIPAARRGEAERLLSAYLWRGFATSRYGHLAQDRLLEDYQGLRSCLHALAVGTTRRDTPTLMQLAKRVPAFDEKEHPLPSGPEVRRAGWIGTSSKLGRTIAALATAAGARDWRTGETLGADRVRTLEAAKGLERHYIFPPSLLEAAGVEPKRGVNGVLLAKGEPGIKGQDPKDLLNVLGGVRKGMDDLKLRARVQSHLVSHGLLGTPGATLAYRYEEFVKERSTMIAARIRLLATP